MHSVKRMALMPIIIAGLMFGGVQTTSADPADGLVAHWPMDEEDPAGFTPEIINGNDGGLQGGASIQIIDIAPVFGNLRAAEFGGVAADYVDIADDASLDLPGNITVAVWLNLESLVDDALGAVVLMKEEVARPATSNYTLAIRADLKPVFALTFADIPNAGPGFPRTEILGIGGCNGFSGPPPSSRELPSWSYCANRDSGPHFGPGRSVGFPAWTRHLIRSSLLPWTRIRWHRIRTW